MSRAKKYILDSDIIIKFLRDDPDAIRTVSKLSGSYALSAISYIEVATFELAKNPLHFRTVQKYLTQEKLYSLTGTASKQAARVQAKLLRNNQQMGFQDLCIAATAVEQKAVLVTRNHNHFKLYPGLQILVW